MTRTRTAEPANAFAALWLTHALEAAEAHRRSFTRGNMQTLAPWIAANVDQNGNVTQMRREVARQTGINRSAVRGAFRQFERAGYLTATPNATEDGLILPTTYGLALPASVVDAELEAMASAEALADLDAEVTA